MLYFTNYTILAIALPFFLIFSCTQPRILFPEREEVRGKLFPSFSGRGAFFWMEISSPSGRRQGLFMIRFAIIASFSKSKLVATKLHFKI
jgi:hypothetical protein